MTKQEKRHTTAVGINLPIQMYVRLSKIESPDENRYVAKSAKDVIDPKSWKHVMRLVDSIREHGFMNSITVFPTKNPGEFFLSVDENHSLQALRYLHPNEDPLVPIKILWWKDPSDAEQIQSVIIKLNVTDKRWLLYDYISSHSKMNGRSNHKIMVEIRESMKKYQSIGLTNGVVASAYTKDSRNHTGLRDGIFIQDAADKPYTDRLLERLKRFVVLNGASAPNAPFMRRLVTSLWKTADGWKDYAKWEKFFEYLLKDIQAFINNPNAPLPDGDETFKDFYNKTIVSYENSIKVAV